MAEALTKETDVVYESLHVPIFNSKIIMPLQIGRPKSTNSNNRGPLDKNNFTCLQAYHKANPRDEVGNTSPDVRDIQEGLRVCMKVNQIKYKKNFFWPGPSIKLVGWKAKSASEQLRTTGA